MDSISKNKNMWLKIGLLATALMIVGTGCAGSADAANPVYQTERIETGDLSANIIANGAVRPNRTQDISWQTR